MCSQIKCQAQLITSLVLKATSIWYSLPVNGIFFFEGEYFAKTRELFVTLEYQQQPNPGYNNRNATRASTPKTFLFIQDLEMAVAVTY